MVNKKGQTKIQQTAIMLIALTLLFIMAGLFLFSLKFSDLKKSANLIQEENAVILASKLSSSPEFSCEEAFGNKRINCIDGDKLIVLLEENEKYTSFFKVSNIEVRIIYPIPEKEILCTPQNYPNCNIYRIGSQEIIGIDSSSFVVVCRKDLSENQIYNKCTLARLSISYNKK